MPSAEHPLAPITIRLKRLPRGEGLPVPAYATAGAAGMDVVAAEELDLMPGQRYAVATGFAGLSAEERRARTFKFFI